MTKRKPKLRWITTAKQMAIELGLSEKNFHKNWKNREGFPEKTKKGWNLLKCLEAYEAEKEKMAAEAEGENADFKREKLRLECDILKERLSALRGDSIPMAEHVSEISEYAHMVNGVFEKFREQAVAKFRKTGLVKNLDRLIDRAQRRLQRAIDNA